MLNIPTILKNSNKKMKLTARIKVKVICELLRQSMIQDWSSTFKGSKEIQTELARLVTRFLLIVVIDFWEDKPI